MQTWSAVTTARQRGHRERSARAEAPGPASQLHGSGAAVSSPRQGQEGEGPSWGGGHSYLLHPGGPRLLAPVQASRGLGLPAPTLRNQRSLLRPCRMQVASLRVDSEAAGSRPLPWGGGVGEKNPLPLSPSRIRPEESPTLNKSKVITPSRSVSRVLKNHVCSRNDEVGGGLSSRAGPTSRLTHHLPTAPQTLVPSQLGSISPCCPRAPPEFPPSSSSPGNQPGWTPSSTPRGPHGKGAPAGTLTEHGLQPHEAAHEAVEVHGQVGLRVAGDNEFVQLLVELEAWPRRAGEAPGGAGRGTEGWAG